MRALLVVAVLAAPILAQRLDDETYAERLVDHPLVMVGDLDTAVSDWAYSFGFGGRGIIPGREADVFGLGFFDTNLNTGQLATLFGVDSEERGFEAFYNFQVTPWIHITGDVQVVDSGIRANGTPVILGLRGAITL